MKRRDDRLLNINYELEKPCIEIELNTAIGSMKLGSAPGIDQIDNHVISSLPDESNSPLENL